MTRRRKLLVTLLAGLAGLLMAELAVRIGHLGILPPLDPTGGVTSTSKDPLLRYENMPHGWMHFDFKDRFGKVVRVVDMHTNSRGLRGPEVELEKAPGTFRIACLGDSQTFGHGVSDGEDYPRVLETALGMAQPGRSIEVLNFAVCGYDTEQEVELLRSKAFEFQPDLVLLGFFLNDTALRNTHVPADESVSGWWIHGQAGNLAVAARAHAVARRQLRLALPPSRDAPLVGAARSAVRRRFRRLDQGQGAAARAA